MRIDTATLYRQYFNELFQYTPEEQKPKKRVEFQSYIEEAFPYFFKTDMCQYIGIEMPEFKDDCVIVSVPRYTYFKPTNNRTATGCTQGGYFKNPDDLMLFKLAVR